MLENHNQISIHKRFLISYVLIFGYDFLLFIVILKIKLSLDTKN